MSKRAYTKMKPLDGEMLSAIAVYMKKAMDGNDEDFLDGKGIHAIGHAFALDTYFRKNGGFDESTHRHNAEAVYETLYKGMEKARDWRIGEGYAAAPPPFPYEPFKEVKVKTGESSRKDWQRWLYMALDVYLMAAFGLDMADKPLAKAIREFRNDICEEIANDACLEDFNMSYQ